MASRSSGCCEFHLANIRQLDLSLDTPQVVRVLHGKAKPYQVKQVRQIVQHYGLGGKEDHDE